MGHWYSPSGVPCHTIIGKNGKERDTTLRDARQLNLLPSVTTIMSLQDKPALNTWLQNELLLAAMENPYERLCYSEVDWKAYTLKIMRIKSRKAAERGTQLHNKLEEYFTNGKVCKKDKEYIIPAIELIENTFPNKKWVAEGRFASMQHGYAGCVDLHCDDIIIDFKTKDKTDIKDMQQYDDHKMQLAAYQNGLEIKNARRLNLFLSTNEETKGLCVFREDTDYERYRDMFLLLNQFWQKKNKYVPVKGE